MQINGFFNRWRIYFIGILIFFAFVYIYLNYAQLAFGPKKTFSTRPPMVERGSIVDRNGKPLAVQTNFYHYGVTPSMIKNPQNFAIVVAPVLDMRAEDIINRINTNKGSSFIYLKKKLSQEKYHELSTVLAANNYNSFSRFDKIPGRIYPENDLASQLIGYMGDDGSGLSGIEYSQQAVLSPPLPPEATEDIYGCNVYLTIDANLQYRLEKIAKATMETTQAESMMLVAAYAKTGEILSCISLPSCDLNAYTSATPDETINRPAMSAYEPGSVFKIFSSAAFIDSGVIDEDNAFLCDGIYEQTTKLGETIRITCLDHHGWVTVRGALKYSCNDAIAQMSDQLNTSAFLSYIHKFGFGERTGIELPAETKGSVKDTSDKYWSARSKPTMSIGQEISVNALQMVQAATILANKGTPVKLTVIERITDRNGTDKYVHTPTYGEPALKASTAQYILSCMQTTAESGTGFRVIQGLGDVSIGVKTGTAQMADPINGGYSETDFVSNCLAIFPIEDPEIVLYIVIEKAKGETYAGRIVAPVIAEVADEILDHLGIIRDNAPTFTHEGVISIVENKAISIGDTVPNFTGRPKRDLVPLLDDDHIRFIINGEGWVVSQSPEPGTPITEDMTIELTLE